MSGENRIDVVVGAGGVGKTTVAAATALSLADAGHRTLVMTFDPSWRLKDTLGLGESAAAGEVPVEGCQGLLFASLLDARRTFDTLIERYAPDDAVRQRILTNPYYRHLAGSLAGIFEFMAVERLFEVVQAERFERIVLDTPPISQALDLLTAPERIVSFLDSGAIRLATRSWFNAQGRLKAGRRLGPLGPRLETYLDELCQARGGASAGLGAAGCRRPPRSDGPETVGRLGRRPEDSGRSPAESSAERNAGAKSSSSSA